MPCRVLFYCTAFLTCSLVSCSGDAVIDQSVSEVVVPGSENQTDNEKVDTLKHPFVGGPVMFTEVDPVNLDYEDHEGGDAGWVELYNTSSEPANLTGMYLTNSLSEPQKWKLGKIVIPPLSFLLIYLSEKNYPDYVAPSDTVNLAGNGCWTWTDSQNEDPPGESTTKNLPGKKNLCFTENGIRRFGATMQFGENKELGWTSISDFVGAKSGSESDVVDLSNSNEVLLNAYITKDRKISLRLVQAGLDDWKGYETVLTGTGDSSTVYRFLLPKGKSLPDLENIYGTRFSPEANERKEVTFKAFSYIARNRGHEPHASFKIKNAPGSLYLMNAAGGIMASVDYKDVPAGKSWSYGFFADSLSTAADNVGWGYADPSPNALASNFVNGMRSPSLDSLAEFPPSGFYSTAFVVTLPQDQNIRCEMGGAEPSAQSPLMTQLNVSSTKVVRCASFAPGAIPGEVTNRTYIFENAPTLPAVFLTGDPKSLFDPDTGIYMDGPNASSAEPHYGANYWEDKELPIFVELIEKGTAQPAFAENAGFKIFGNYSRANGKKSVAITFREKYGNKRLKYQLFPDFPELKKFKVFVLRNNGSNFTNDYIRDMLASSISEGLGVDYQRGRASVVYYNGEYYGIHNIRERATEYYFETHYGMEPDDIDLLKADNSASNGSSVEYQQLMDWLDANHLDSEENYAKVASQIDVDNFMNYVQLEMFVNNRDWPSNNLKKWRNSKQNTLWKWFIYDTDFGFGNTYSEYSNNIFEFATNAEGSADAWPNGPNSTLLLRRLLENENFKLAFVNRMTTLLSMNFETSRVSARINTLMSAISAEISRDQKRWSHSSSHMNDELETIKIFAKNRPGVIVREMREFFKLDEIVPVTLSVNGGGSILVHGLPIDRFPISVNFFKGLPVVVSAVPDAGKIWAGWDDGVLDQIRVVNPEEIPSLTAVFK